MISPREAASALLIVLLTATGARSQTPFARQPLQKDHPAVGAWRIELPQLNCFEQMDFRPDGTRSVISGKEIAQAEFAISQKPDARGFYNWSDRILSVNGQPDCVGSLTKAGTVSHGFMVFNDDKNSFFLCPDADGKSCIGPYVKIAGTDS